MSEYKNRDTSKHFLRWVIITVLIILSITLYYYKITPSKVYAWVQSVWGDLSQATSPPVCTTLGNVIYVQSPTEAFLECKVTYTTKTELNKPYIIHVAIDGKTIEQLSVTFKGTVAPKGQGPSYSYIINLPLDVVKELQEPRNQELLALQREWEQLNVAHDRANYEALRRGLPNYDEYQEFLRGLDRMAEIRTLIEEAKNTRYPYTVNVPLSLSNRIKLEVRRG